MNKNTIFIIVLLVVGIALLFLLGPAVDEGVEENTSIDIPEETTTFAETGTVTFDNPGSEGAVLVYEAPGASALTKSLVFDERSVCATENGATECLAMSVTLDVPFGGKRVVLEGIDLEENTVLVRKLRVLREGEPSIVAEPGDTFITWQEARDLIENCDAEMVAQTHALDVYIILDDGQRVRAVEPVIDEVFHVLEGARETCGTIPVATE